MNRPEVGKEFKFFKDDKPMKGIVEAFGPDGRFQHGFKIKLMTEAALKEGELCKIDVGIPGREKIGAKVDRVIKGGSIYIATLSTLCLEWHARP